MERQLSARVQVRVADRVLPWSALPRWDVVSVGRTSGYGVPLMRSWVPRKLCRFVPTEMGWVVQVGPRPRMRVRDRYVVDHVFQRRAVVALQRGTALMSFPELDDWCEIAVVISEDGVDGLPELRDSVVEDGIRGETAYAAKAVALTPAQRQVVAVAYQHLLSGGPKPVNVAETAAARLGTSTQMVKNRLADVRRKVNVERWGPKLATHEDVAHYLMNLTRTISLEDVPRRLR